STPTPSCARGQAPNGVRRAGSAGLPPETGGPRDDWSGTRPGTGAAAPVTPREAPRRPDRGPDSPAPEQRITTRTRYGTTDPGAVRDFQEIRRGPGAQRRRPDRPRGRRS